jgi:hypothetical protein
MRVLVAENDGLGGDPVSTDGLGEEIIVRQGRHHLQGGIGPGNPPVRKDRDDEGE